MSSLFASGETDSVRGMSRRSTTIAVVALVALTVVTYLPALRGGFIWDDNEHILHNSGISAPDGLRAIWASFVLPVYYPLTFTVFRFIYQTWGANPLPYHAITLLLHAATAVLLLFVLRRLNVRGAWGAAALWAVHPVSVESVAWVTELKNTLSGVWFFATILCFLCYERELKQIWFVSALICFASALLSKSSTVVLPAVLLLCAWWQRGRISRTDVVRSLPFFGLSLAASVVAVWAQVMEKLDEGAARDWALRWPERLIVAGKDLWFYAGKILCPFDLMFIYPRWSHHPGVWTEWLPSMGAAVAGVILWRFRHAVWGHATVFALGYFVIALSPVLGLFDQYFYRYSFVADHFQYLASVGIIALVTSGAATLARARRVQLGAAAVAIALLGTLSWQRCHAFHNEETVWLDTLARNPAGWMAHNNLGGMYLERGRFDDAEAHLRVVVRYKPDNAGVRNNLGTALLRQGKLVEAIVEYQQAVQLDPDYAEVHYNLGSAWAELGKQEEAAAQFLQALRTRPDYAEAHYNLANTLLLLCRLEEAAEHYQQAVRFAPRDVDARFALAALLAQRGNLTEAATQYQIILQLKPDYAAAHFNLANTILQLGYTAEAIAHYRDAVSLQPRLLPAHFNLAGMLLREGHTAEAIEHYQQALAIKPDLVEAQYKLVVAWARFGNFDNATNCCERTLRINAGIPEALADCSWLLSTHDGIAPSDLKRAVEWAESACRLSQDKEPAYLSALASAYAADGQFANAVAVAEKAHELAGKTGAAQLEQHIADCLKLYRAERPYQVTLPARLPSEW